MLLPGQDRQGQGSTGLTYSFIMMTMMIIMTMNSDDDGAAAADNDIKTRTTA